MRTDAGEALEFNVILKDLALQAVSERAKEKLLSLKPFLGEAQCKAKMKETTEAKRILERCGTPPLSLMKDLDKLLDLTGIGMVLSPVQLTDIAGFISACVRMKRYLKKSAGTEDLALLGDSFLETDALYGEIERSVRNNAVDDRASPALHEVRRKIARAEEAVREKLEGMLRGRKEIFADAYVTVRRGRTVLSVKKEYRSQVPGTVVDMSGSGSTLFIEPEAVGKLQDELSTLRIGEENEILRILYTLTSLVADEAGALKNNMDCMETLDIAFAKAKLSVTQQAVPVPVGTERRIKIVRGRHPLLKQESCVPLDFETGGDLRGVVITGPNTGGKTVALKTVGLLSMMAQSGLHIPADGGSELCMHGNILCDIGDGQSITENLSTFSSHITNIVAILGSVTSESLVLLDELGSGTDPAEGMGLAIAVLEELRRKNCLFLATTHYPEVKEYVKNTDNLQNARMTFDRESLMPLYRLEIGEAGESCALYIAQRLGFPAHLLTLARKAAYGGRRSAEIRETVYEADESSAPAGSGVIRKEEPRKTPLRSESFHIGDSVTVYPKKEIGFVYRTADEKGNLGVQIKGEKQTVNHKRLKLLTPAEELYPENYDFSIVFDSVANRKARHRMQKKHDPGLVIEYGGEEKK